MQLRRLYGVLSAPLQAVFDHASAHNSEPKCYKYEMIDRKIGLRENVDDAKYSHIGIGRWTSDDAIGI